MKKRNDEVADRRRMLEGRNKRGSGGLRRREDGDKVRRLMRSDRGSDERTKSTWIWGRKTRSVGLKFEMERMETALDGWMVGWIDLVVWWSGLEMWIITVRSGGRATTHTL